MSKFIEGDVSGITWADPPSKTKAPKPVLVKAGRQAWSKALEFLKQLPDAEPDKIAVPWEIESRPKIQDSEWEKSDLKSWVITDLFATQKFVTRSNVEWHLLNFDTVPEGQHGNPNVVVVNGKPLIYDGHHRLASIWLLGAETANCWTLEK